MAWLFATAVFLAAIWLLVQYPVLRRVALFGALGVAALVGGMILYAKERNRAAAEAISPSQIEIADLTIARPYVGSTADLAGTIRNHSAHDLSFL
jgi:hypothetical protein